jgi:hypothetical protein
VGRVSRGKSLDTRHSAFSAVNSWSSLMVEKNQGRSLIAPGAGAKGVERGAEGTRPLQRLSPTRMPSVHEPDPAPVLEER